MYLIIFAIILFIVILYLIYRPSIDYVNGSILIWYNEEPYKRHFIKIKIK